MPYNISRGNNVTHGQFYNTLLQPTESYETTNGSGLVGTTLFVSCPNWGLTNNTSGSNTSFNICPAASNTKNNGTLQGYAEYQGGPGYSSYLSFSQSLSYDGLNRLTQDTDSGGWARTFNYDRWGNMWVTNASGPLAGNTPTSNVYNSGTNRDGRWTYDGAGNLLTVNGNTASYNAENEVTGVAGAGI